MNDERSDFSDCQWVEEDFRIIKIYKNLFSDANILYLWGEKQMTMNGQKYNN